MHKGVLQKVIFPEVKLFSYVKCATKKANASRKNEKIEHRSEITQYNVKRANKRKMC